MHTEDTPSEVGAQADAPRATDQQADHGDGIVVRTVLIAGTAWDGAAYSSYPDASPQLTVLRFSIPPHSSLPWHRHVVPNAAFLIEGELTLEDRESGATRVFGAGEAFGESVGNVHRGVTGQRGAEVVVTYAGAPGIPLSIPVD